jgi:hypothetical protein
MISAEALEEYCPNLFCRQRYDPAHDLITTVADHDAYGRPLPKLELLPSHYRVERERLLAEKQGIGPIRSPSSTYPPNSKHDPGTDVRAKH